MAVLIDTSAIVAAVDRADPAHARVVEALGAERAPILVPVVTLPEVAYLVEARHGAARSAAVLGRIVQGGWSVVGLDAPDLARATDLMAQYADSRLGFVDSAIVALAERLLVTRVHTLDHRDFGLVRPRHVGAFEVVPAPP